MIFQVWRYARFGLMNLLILLAAFFMMLGGGWMWVGFGIAVLIGSIVDEITGDDTQNPSYLMVWVFNALLYLTLPFLVLLSLIYATMLSVSDPFGVAGFAQSVLGIDMLQNRAQTEWWHWLGAFASIGIIYGAAGTNVAHELIHRIKSPIEFLIGRWLLAFTLDTTFAIEHVYGHHRTVATLDDPATARRGESLWSFIVRSSVFSFINAFRFEAQRLRNRGSFPWGIRNRALPGQFMSLVLIAAFYYAAGWIGVLAFIGVALIGKAYLEFVNYIEHYGLVRVKGTRVEPRHSWNCNRLISNAILYNLPRHSHHHTEQSLPFWKLRSDLDAPTMPYGYETMIFLAMVPKLWWRVMDPCLADWDARFASEKELALIKQRGW